MSKPKSFEFIGIGIFLMLVGGGGVVYLISGADVGAKMAIGMPLVLLLGVYCFFRGLLEKFRFSRKG